MENSDRLKIEFANIQLALEGLQAQANQLLQKKQEIIAEIIREKNKLAEGK